MKRYRVTSEVTISLSTVVYAKSKAQALSLASDKPIVSLCHQCADGEQDEEWVTSGELDGEPQNLVVEEEDDY